jgi:hypothetical protein
MTTASKRKPRRRGWEPAPPDPGIIPGGIRDRAMRAVTPPAARTASPGGVRKVRGASSQRSTSNKFFDRNR